MKHAIEMGSGAIIYTPTTKRHVQANPPRGGAHTHKDTAVKQQKSE
jgi:hypothetical protein